MPKENLLRSDSNNSDSEYVWSQAEQRLLNGSELRSEIVYRGASAECLVNRAALEERKWGLGHEVVLEILGEFAKLLRPYEEALYRAQGYACNFTFPRMVVSNSVNSLAFEYLGSGHYGTAFKVSYANAQDLVLKVFYPSSGEHRFFSGPYSETALGIYVSGQQVSNMPHLLAANPTQGWLLTEFVSGEFRSQTSNGPTWQQLGLVALDQANSKHNNISDAQGQLCRVDYGHLTNKERQALESCSSEVAEVMLGCRRHKNFLSGKEFLGLLADNKESRGYLFGQLVCVAPEDRLAVLEYCSCFSEFLYFPVQDYFEAKVFESDQTLAVFNILMQSTDPLMRSKAVFSTKGLIDSDRIKLEKTWAELPEFAYFRMYRGDREARQFLLGA